jgi:hypothetical protein
MRSPFVLVGIALLALGCGGIGVESPPSADAGSTPGQATTDAGAGCGLSFDEAVEAYPGERVCQTTVYDRVTGYCSHWQPCSSL